MIDNSPVSSSNSSSIPIYEIILLFVGVISAISLALLAINHFTVINTLLLGSILSVSILAYFRLVPSFSDSRFTVVVLLVLLIALWLRADLYTNFMGGYDQGLYVNMSETFVRDGGFNFVDRFRTTLSGELLNSYDAARTIGMTLIDSDKSMSTIEFYPLHPAWMAIFGQVFGLGRHTLSVLFFSILSLIGLYLLALELFEKNKFVAYIALFLGAINPALVFFSKYPVTEIVALAFSANGFYLLLRGLRSQDITEKRISLTISLLLFNAFFYTRMSYIVLFPIFFVLIIISYSSFIQSNIGLSIRKYTSILFLLLAINTLYYFCFQNTFFKLMYSAVWDSGLWKYKVILEVSAIIFFVFSIIIIVYYNRLRKMLAGHRVADLLNKSCIVMPWFFLTSLAMSIISLVRLYHYGDLHPFPYVVPIDGLTFRYHAIYRYMLMVSPFGFILLASVPFLKVNFSKLTTLLLFFLSSIWIIILLLAPYLPYLYFYSRYLASEMIPYSIVLLAFIFGELINRGGTSRKLGWLFISLTAVYCLFISIGQIGKLESEDPNFFYAINNYVKQEDVIVLLEDDFDNRIPIPLRYYFDKQVYIVSRQTDMRKTRNDVAQLFRQSGEKYGNILFLTTKTKDETILNANMELIGKYLFNEGLFFNSEHPRAGGVNLTNYPAFSLAVQEKVTALRKAASTINVFGKSIALSEAAALEKSIAFIRYLPLLPPVIHTNHITPVFLYKLTEAPSNEIPAVPIGGSIKFSKGGGSSLYIKDGWSFQEDAFRWTDSKTATVQVRIIKRKNPAGVLLLRVNAFAYTGGVESQQVIIKVNDKEVGNQRVGSNFSQFDVILPPGTVDSEGNAKIDFILPDAHSPLSAGKSNDTRGLGLAVQEISFAEIAN